MGERGRGGLRGRGGGRGGQGRRRGGSVAEFRVAKKQRLERTQGRDDRDDRDEKDERDGRDGEGEGRRAPKKKYALIFGYNGRRFHGMQRQQHVLRSAATDPRSAAPPMDENSPLTDGSPSGASPVSDESDKELRTVEGELFEALLKIGALTPQLVNRPEWIMWSRVGRTDAGVHAACQVVTAKLNIIPRDSHSSNDSRPSTQTPSTTNTTTTTPDFPPPGEGKDDPQCEIKRAEFEREREQEFIKRLSAALPADIKLFDVVRVRHGFDARFQAMKRQYEYCVPSYVLAPFDLVDNTQPLLEFSARFIEGKPDPSPRLIQYKKEDLKLREHLLPFDLKQRVYNALNPSSKPLSSPTAADCCSGEGEETKRMTKYALLEELCHSTCSNPESDALDLQLDLQLATSEQKRPTLLLGDLVLAWRRELSLIRKAYGSLNEVEREEVWKVYGAGEGEGSERLERGDGPTPAYPPAALTALRRPRFSAETRKNFRLADTDFDRFQATLNKFKGTHNFFNFTSRKAATDPSTARNIFDLDLHRAFDDARQGEILVVRLRGQSFLLNQIRKMVALAIESHVGVAGQSAIEWCLAKETLTPKRHLHLAPGEGLLLERAYFSNYLDWKTQMLKSTLELHDSHETLHPFGPKIDAFIDRGLTTRPPPQESSASKGSNCLLDDTAPATDVPEIVQTAESKEQGMVEASWFKESENERPDFWKILNFKFKTLYPEMLAVFETDKVWERYLSDSQWHPFFSENFPKSIETDLLYPNNKPTQQMHMARKQAEASTSTSASASALGSPVSSEDISEAARAVSKESGGQESVDHEEMTVAERD